jgi:hypothetical protein
MSHLEFERRGIERRPEAHLQLIVTAKPLAYRSGTAARRDIARVRKTPGGDVLVVVGEEESCGRCTHALICRLVVGGGRCTHALILRLDRTSQAPPSTPM